LIQKQTPSSMKWGGDDTALNNSIRLSDAVVLGHIFPHSACIKKNAKINT
jgi:hypothetical protein